MPRPVTDRAYNRRQRGWHDATVGRLCEPAVPQTEVSTTTLETHRRGRRDRTELLRNQELMDLCSDGPRPPQVRLTMKDVSHRLCGLCVLCGERKQRDRPGARSGLTLYVAVQAVCGPALERFDEFDDGVGVGHAFYHGICAAQLVWWERA